LGIFFGVLGHGFLLKYASGSKPEKV
jgi:hypothetical protein